MLNIIADALLIAIRMDPQTPHQPRRPSMEDTTEKAHHRWFAQTGLRR